MHSEGNRRSFVTLFLVLANLIAAAACTAKKSQVIHDNSQVLENGSIINGRPVSLQDGFWKHTVSVGPKEEPSCTGVIVSNDTILTAGHCADGLENTYVHFGLDFADYKNTIRLKIKSVTTHPDYCDTCVMNEKLGDPADIAVVIFNGALPAGFAPIEFAKKEDLKIGQTITLVGFGLNEKNKYETIMKVTTVPLKELGSTEFSTDETKSGSCNGDSGGPAFFENNGKYTLAGITSRGDAKCRQVGVYTIPDSFNDWILEIATAP